MFFMYWECDVMILDQNKPDISIFRSMLMYYETYLKMYYNDNVDNIKTTRPEDIFEHHFNKYNKKVAIEPIIQYIFGHVCNAYCGHNGNNTKT